MPSIKSAARRTSRYVLDSQADSGLGTTTISIPISASNLAGFRDWAKSPQLPRNGRVSFLQQEILIDMAPEELETHNKIKTEIGRVIPNLNVELNLGIYYSDRSLVSNVKANLSTEPDATFVTWESLEQNRVRLVPRQGQSGQYLELEGTPDWVLEIVSESSVAKDTKKLRRLYQRAGIPEYWLIDGRPETLVFQILYWRPTGYVAAPRQGAWHRSRVFGRRFRLRRQRDRLGLWDYRLDYA
jgi:Uma2 family endonuclease